MSLKVLFLNMSWGTVTELNGTENFSPYDKVMPYSLLVGAEYARMHGFDVEFYDANLEGDSEEELLAALHTKKFDAVVLPVNSIMVFRAASLLSEIKSQFNAVTIVWHTNSYHEDFIRILEGADYCVPREWYSVNCQLLQCLEVSDSVEKVKGITFRGDDGRFCTTGEPKYHHVMDHPAPPFDLVDLSRYNHLQTLFSEGCDYNCVFCHFGGLYDTGWGSKSVESFWDELKALRGVGHKLIRIVDNELTSNKPRFKELMSRICQSDLQVFWDGNIRANSIDETVIELMAESGCVQAGFGAESGDQRILDLNNKQISLAQIVKTGSWLNKYKIPSRAYFLIGLRGDDKSTIRRTFDFIKNDVVSDTSSFDIVIPHPGTAYNAYLKSQGLLDSVTLEEVMWIYRNMYGYDFLPEEKTKLPRWKYENFSFEELFDLGKELYVQVPNNSIFHRAFKLATRNSGMRRFLLAQAAGNLSGLGRRIGDCFV